MPEKLTFQAAIKCFFLLAAVVSLFSVSAQKTVTGRITNSNDKLNKLPKKDDEIFTPVTIFPEVLFGKIKNLICHA